MKAITSTCSLFIAGLSAAAFASCMMGCDPERVAAADPSAGEARAAEDPGASPARLDMLANASPALDREEAVFLGLINKYRAQNGLGRLVASPTLTSSSKWMSQDMASRSYFSHTDSMGRSPFTRMAAFAYNFSTYMGENIAAGFSDAQSTFVQWRNSPAHNANMLNPGFRAIGIGRGNGRGAYGWYWTTDFGGFVDQVIAE